MHIYESDWTEQAGISIGEWKAAQLEIEELQKTKDLFDFLKQFFYTTHLDHWEKDGFVEMKKLYFQFSDDIDVEDMDFVINAAMEAQKDYP